MDFEYRLKRKCLSFLISLIFHLLLLLLFFRLAYEIVFVSGPRDNKNNNPVTVTFQNPQINNLLNQIPSPAIQNLQSPAPQSNLSQIEANSDQYDKNSESKEEISQINQTDSIEQEQLTETEQEFLKPNLADTKNSQLHDSEAISDAVTEIVPEAVLDTAPAPQPTHEKIDIETTVSESLQTDTTANTTNIQKATAPTKNVSAKRARNRRRIAMLAKKFVNSFRNSYRAEKEIITPANHNGIRTNRSFIEERIEEFRIADFMKKVRKALVEAIHKTPEVQVRSDKNYDKSIVLQIEHFKDGKIKILTFESTGIPEVDYQIKFLLNNISFPTIPERFKKNSITYTHQFGVHVKEGMNICRFYAY